MKKYISLAGRHTQPSRERLPMSVSLRLMQFDVYPPTHNTCSKIASKPLMLQTLLAGISLRRVDDEHGADQVLRSVRDVVPVWRGVGKPPFRDLLSQGVRVGLRGELVLERVETAKADVQNHAGGPDIYAIAVSCSSEGLHHLKIGRASCRERV